MQYRLLIKFFLLIVLGVLAVGCGDSGDSVEPGEIQAPTVVQGTILLSSQRTEGPPAGEKSFPLNTLVDLNVYIAWREVSGDHTMEVRYFSPDGQLYQRKNISFSTSGAASAPRKTKAETGIPHAEGLVDFAGGTIGVWTFLPVGGTWITAHGLSGTWRVEVFLDNGSTPITTGTFSLTD